MGEMVIKNYLYMVEKLGKTRKEVAQDGVFSERTEGRLVHGTYSVDTINKLVEYYNKHGAVLYPHHVEFDDFVGKDLSAYKEPNWSSEQVKGEYVGLYLSRRGTGKVKAMILAITENDKFMLEARAIDSVQNPEKAADLIKDILAIDDLEQARKTFEETKEQKKSLLRGSRFLFGEVSGRGDLLCIHMKDVHGTYEVTLSTSLKSYLNTYNAVPAKYNWRGGATVASVYDMEDWPYSMVIGFARLMYWNPELMVGNDMGEALQRMHRYQKKENMLCLHNDIDALFYESIMDNYRKTEELQNAKKTKKTR